MIRKVFLIGLGLTLATLFLQAQNLPIYLDTTYTDTARADDLIQRMTLDEKLAQLQNSMQLAEPGSTGVGAFGFMSKDNDIAGSVRQYNQYQRAQIENTRLGIPATRSGEGLFAYMGNGSTSFPSPIGIAASFDPSLQAKVAGVLATELKSQGVRRVLAPVVNLTRDPRWGRTNETYGEAPYLSGQMGAAYVRVMEEAGLSTMIKHFVANMGLDGQFTGPVHFTERHLREYYFPAFKTCIEAGASSVMMAYNNIDGIPCATNPWLIMDILKGEWGLGGFVSTDGQSSTFIMESAGMYKTKKDRAVAKLDKPTAVVIQSGTVITMNDWIGEVDTVLMGWYPGCEGGHAIAAALFGDYNPGGKLPITFPKVTGQVPLNYNRHLKGKEKIKFIGDFNEPLFSFGHGLSYSQFEYDNLELSASTIQPGDTVLLRFRVTNTSDRTGEEVAQLYLHDPYATVTQPIQKLIGFERLALEAGASKTVELRILPEQLKIWDINMKYVIEPGDFELMVGSSSTDIRLNALLTVEP